MPFIRNQLFPESLRRPTSVVVGVERAPGGR
jgi:hypothetical protein